MAQQRPNILLITTDQQRYDAMGFNGNPILRTPNLDALAASGFNFSRCYVTCPVCIPARRTLLSGQHPETHGLRRYADTLDWDPPHTLPGVLRDAGYQTQLIGKIHQQPQRRRYGFDHMVLSDSANFRPNSRFQIHNDYTDWLEARGLGASSNAHGIDGNSRLARPFHLEERFHQTSWLTEQAGRFFDKWRDPSCPWFLHLSYTAPHPPLTPPGAYWDRYAHRDDLAPVIGQWVPQDDGKRRGLDPASPAGPFPPDEIHDAIAGYYGLVNHIDDCIHFAISRFREYATTKSAEPLLIVFSSDHGEMLGDHHLFRKSLGYEGSARVPFFITGYNMDLPNGSCDALVGWEDIMPTILDAAGAAIPDSVDGRSLLPVMRGEAEGVRDLIFGQTCAPAPHDRLNNLWIVDGRFKYIWFPFTNEEQCFDLQEDPDERQDLSAESDKLAPYRAMLAEQIAHRDDLAFDRSSCVPCRNRPPRALWPNA
mgnify:CR=1 FL=1